MNTLLKVAVMLTAYDAMSREVQSAVGKSKKELNDLQAHSRQLFGQGAGLLGAGAAGFNVIGKTIKDFADLQEGALDLKSTMMKDGGVLNVKQFEDINKIAVELGNKLPGTTSDFHQMFTTMINNGITAENIMSGVGAASANLAVVLKRPYDEVGKAIAQLRTSTGVADEDMLAFADTIARTSQLGVDLTDMQYAFAKSGGALKLMDLQGLQASKSVSALYAELIRAGNSGETVGTNMTAIFNSVTNKDKMAGLNAELAKYGISMDFVDRKTGKFAGIENMVAQFSKIKSLGLGVEDMGAITRVLLGPGGDANLMNTIVNNGVEGFNKMVSSMASQASLTDKVDTKTSGLNSQMEAFKGTVTNISASIGARFEPLLTAVAKAMNAGATAVANFVQNNPKLTELIVLILGFTSAALAVAGVVKIFQGIIAVMRILNIVMKMNPFVIYVGLAILALSLIITYWTPITGFFKRLWAGVTSVFNTFVSWCKFVFLATFAPSYLIYKHWDQLAPYFSKVWMDVKKVFWGLVTWFVGLHLKMYDAGRNIVMSIWNGIKSMASKPVEAIMNIVKNMRDLLPFSPAKTGPFKDLHKIKIVETLAASIKAPPMVGAMRNVLSQTANLNGRAPSLARAGGGVVINYNPTINIGAGANKADLMAVLNEHISDIARMLKNEESKMSRTRF